MAGVRPVWGPEESMVTTRGLGPAVDEPAGYRYGGKTLCCECFVLMAEGPWEAEAVWPTPPRFTPVTCDRCGAPLPVLVTGAAH